jgi:hypothetical protein
MRFGKANVLLAAALAAAIAAVALGVASAYSLVQVSQRCAALAREVQSLEDALSKVQAVLESLQQRYSSLHRNYTRLARDVEALRTAALSLNYSALARELSSLLSRDIQQIRAEVAELKGVNPTEEASYVVFVGEDGRYYVKNGTTGHVEYSDVDATNALQYAIDRLAKSGGGKVVLRRGCYRVAQPARPQLINSGDVIVEGEGSSTTVEIGYVGMPRAGPVPIVNRGRLVLRNLKIVAHADRGTTLWRGHAYFDTGGGTLVFERVEFDLPIAVRPFIFYEGGELHLYDCGIIRGGRDDVEVFSFAEGKGLLRVRNFVVEHLRANATKGDVGLFRYACSLGSEIDGLVVKNISAYSAYLVCHVPVVRNVKLLGGVVGRKVVIAYFRLIENVDSWVRSTVLEEATPYFANDTSNQLVIIRNVRFYAGGGIDLGQPSKGEIRRAVIDGIYCTSLYCTTANCPCIYGGGFEVYEISNVVCDDMPQCIRINDEGDTGNPIRVIANNVYHVVRGRKLEGYAYWGYSLFGAEVCNTNLKSAILHSVVQDIVGGDREIPVHLVWLKRPDQTRTRDLQIIINNAIVRTFKLGRDGGPRLLLVGGSYPERLARPNETMTITIANSVIYTEDPPLGGWSADNPWGLPIGRLDRIVNTRVYNSYDGSPVALSVNAQAFNLKVGANNVYGPASTFLVYSGVIKHFDARINVSHLASGETLIVKIEAVHEDGTVTYVERSFSSTGAYSVAFEDKLKLFGGGKEVIRLNFYAKTDRPSTSATVTVAVYGSG